MDYQGTEVQQVVVVQKVRWEMMDLKVYQVYRDPWLVDTFKHSFSPMKRLLFM